MVDEGKTEAKSYPLKGHDMVIPENFLKDLGRLIIWYPLRRIIKILPPGKDFTLIKYIGRFYYYCGKVKVTELKENLFAMLDLFDQPLTLKQIIMRNLETHFMNQYLVFLFSKFNQTNIDKYHSFAGWKHLENALEKGKGCIILHGHFGPAQLPLIHLGVINFPVTQIGYHPQGNNLSSIGKIVQKKKIKMEMHSSVNIVMADSFLRPIFHLLKNNGIVMMTGDGVGGGKFIGKYCPVFFLTRTVLFPEGPASLAQKTGAVLLPAFTIPGNENCYKTIIEKPLNLLPSGSLEKDTKKNTQAFASIMEKYVKKYPHQWHFWDEFEEGKLIVH